MHDHETVKIIYVIMIKPKKVSILVIYCMRAVDIDFCHDIWLFIMISQIGVIF